MMNGTRIWIGLGILALIGGMVFAVNRAPGTANGVNNSNIQVTNNQVQQNTTNIPASLPKEVAISGVPFTSQAPLGNWSDPRQQDGCEEASVLVAGSWAHGETIGTANEALTKLLELSKLSESMFGTFHDSSAADTLKLYQAYWHSTKGTVKYDITLEDIKQALADGNVVITPMDGRKLFNPNFTAGGPERHMIVITGYNDDTQIFTTQDVGTRKGKNYQYKYSVLMGALRDYRTGDHLPIISTVKAMLVIPKEV